ncbi:unnamed protein product, partial [Amoebophrya sp. A120]
CAPCRRRFVPFPHLMRPPPSKGRPAGPVHWGPFCRPQGSQVCLPSPDFGSPRSAIIVPPRAPLARCRGWLGGPGPPNSLAPPRASLAHGQTSAAAKAEAIYRRKCGRYGCKIVASRISATARILHFQHECGSTTAALE